MLTLASTVSLNFNAPLNSTIEANYSDMHECTRTHKSMHTHTYTMYTNIILCTHTNTLTHTHTHTMYCT